MVDVRKIISILEELAPESIALEWDNVGLQVGDEKQKVDRVLLTLDINRSVLEEARKRGCQLIISHHPLIFKPIKSVSKLDNKGQIITAAINNGISIYCAHTNLDIADNGLNDYLAGLLGIKGIRPLLDSDSPGRIGRLEQEITLGEYIRLVKKRLGLSNIRYVGQKEQLMIRVAVCNGSGAELIQPVQDAGADLFITGDIDYHQAQLAEESGLALIDANHYHSEILVKDLLRDYLQPRLSGVEFLKSQINTNPWNYI
jgi:GTP cyclohydrolase I